MAEPDAVIKIDNAKAVKWLPNGAQPTERVEKLLKTSGAWDEFTGEGGQVTDHDAESVEGDVNRVDGGRCRRLDDELDDEDDDAGDEVDDGTTLDDEARRSTESPRRADAEEGTLAEAVLTHIAHLARRRAGRGVGAAEARAAQVTLRLNVAQQDMGRVIGRRGRTAQAIRTLVAAAGAKEGVSTTVDIVD